MKNALSWLYGICDTVLGLVLFLVGQKRIDDSLFPSSQEKTVNYLLKYVGLALLISGIAWLIMKICQTVFAERRTDDYRSGSEPRTDDFIFCPECGLQVAPMVGSCPRCGTPIGRAGDVPAGRDAFSSPVRDEYSAPVATSAASFCPECGQPVPEGAYACPRCGKVIVSVLSSVSEPASEAAAASGLIGSLSSSGSPSAAERSSAPVHSGLIGSLSGSGSAPESHGAEPVSRSAPAFESPRYPETDEDHYEHTLLVRHSGSDGYGGAGHYEAENSARFCPKCGTSLNESAAYCSSCGCKL